MARGPRPAPAHTGVLLVDKPKGPTSHDVVRAVRRCYRQREVGHTGTLDPMATGLLVITLGRATRLGRYLEATDKRYLGELTLGQATDSYDAEGEVVAEAPVPPDLSEAQVRAALAGLTGRIQQAVPVFSAVKVDGERLHKKARRGEQVEAPVREIEVHSLALRRFASPVIGFEAVVSKGTYIRTLAVQIGEALGLPAHLSMLRRSGVGPHRAEGAATLEQLADPEFPPALIPMAAAVDHLPAVTVGAAGLVDVQHGRQLRVAQLRAGLTPGPWVEGQQLRVLDSEGALVAMASLTAAGADPEAPEHERALSYGCVLAR